VFTSQQQRVVPQETVNQTMSIHSTHTKIPFHHQQPDQKVPSQFYTSQTYVQPQQQQPQHVTVPTYSSTSTNILSNQQQIPLQSVPAPVVVQSSVPQAPPLLSNFNTRPNYSDQKLKFSNGGLKDTPLYTGSETVFECQFTGQANRIQWFRNEVEIMINCQQADER
jgi:hypothetical protein